MFTAVLFTVARTWNQPRCPLTGDWIMKLWYIYIMDYYSATKKERIWVSFNEGDEPRAYYTERSKSEKNKYCILTHIYEIFYRRYWWTYLQGSNGAANIEIRHVGTVGEGEGGMNWNSNTEAYTAPYVKQMASANVWRRELKPSALWRSRAVGCGGRWEGGPRRRGHVYTYRWSCWWTAETNTII